MSMAGEMIKETISSHMPEKSGACFIFSRVAGKTKNQIVTAYKVVIVIAIIGKSRLITSNISIDTPSRSI